MHLKDYFHTITYGFPQSSEIPYATENCLLEIESTVEDVRRTDAQNPPAFLQQSLRVLDQFFRNPAANMPIYQNFIPGSSAK